MSINNKQKPIFLSSLGIINALGYGKAEVLRGLMQGSQCGMVKRDDFLIDGMPIYVGEVSGTLLETPKTLNKYDSRNVRMLMMAAEEIRDDIENMIARVGSHRIAVIMGSSTSGIEESEKFIQEKEQGQQTHNNFYMEKPELGSVSQFLASYFGIKGINYTISTACSSASHALVAGRRLLNLNLVDGVLAGGADSLCKLTTNGFSSLSLLSKAICNPFSKNRDGINIGEGAALFLMQREDAEIALLGCGTSSDAYSMTAPDPKGKGIQLSMLQALKDASLEPEDISYIHLHGTGTLQNDAVESLSIKNIFKDKIPYSSSKGQIGHTLGAAGAMGAAHCWLAASSVNQKKHLPPHIWDGEADENLLTDNFVDIRQTYHGTKPNFLINSFGFGGNNVSLVLRGNV